MGAIASKPRARKLSPSEIADALGREPLVGVTAAAKILGIPPPNFRRDFASRLTEIKVEGSASVFFRSEVTKLAKRRERARSNGRPG